LAFLTCLYCRLFFAKKFKSKMKLSLLALGLAASFASVAQEATHRYEQSVFTGFHKMLPASRSDATSTLASAKKHFPGMAVSVDKLNSSFTDIFGAAQTVSGSTNSDRANFLINHQLKDLGIVPSQWSTTASVEGPKADFINFQQSINGRKVVFANLKFRFTKDGRLERIKSKNYGSVASLLPSLTLTDAKLAAEKDLNGLTIDESSIEPDWLWFPVPGANGYELRPAYAFHIAGQSETLPVDLTGYIDAVSGAVLYRTNNVKETINKTVQGVVYKQNPQLASSAEPLANLKVTIAGTDYYTDTVGFLNVASLNAPITTTVKLEGRWAKVRAAAAANITPSFQYNIATNGTTYLFDTTSPSSIRHINAYYHVNRVHDFMKGFFPTFTAMDNQLQTNVDLSSSTGCNAFYNGSSINFYAATNGCNSFALCGDIVYHEYGHGISDKFYGFMGQGSITNGGLNEGNSDIWGIGITNDPVLGKGSFIGGGIIRRYDQAPKVYPADLIGEVHADGEIIAGAWWDLALNLNSTDTMSKLFALTYWDTPDGPNGTEGSVYHDVLISALMNDDNDNNLNNGTPHFSQIINAFAKHGIYLLGDATLVHSDIQNTPSISPITISANLTLATPAFFQKLDLYYRPRGGQWDTLTMVNAGGTNYTAQIPGQPKGSIIDYYFGVYDNQSLLNASFPLNYLPSASSLTVTIPYQFGVGIAAKNQEDFEGSLNSNWVIGQAPGDNATSGLWMHAKPIGSYVSGVSQQIAIQPNMDHTTGTTGKCLVTGNAGNTTTQPGSADVDGGSTSVITPVFDLTGFTRPIVEYWRWYSNNGGSNPGTDTWSVYIKDITASIWFIRVDNTRATDNNWRRRIFHVDQYLPSSNAISLKFQAADADPGSIVEAAIDDIFIYDEAAAAAIADTKNEKALIYPNPANGYVYVQLHAPATGSISVTDLTGKQLMEKELNGDKHYTLNTEQLPSGTYFVTIKTPQFIQAQKVSIKH